MSRPRYLTTLTTRRGFDSSLILLFSSETGEKEMAQRDLTSNQRLCLMAAIAFVSKFQLKNQGVSLLMVENLLSSR